MDGQGSIVRTLRGTREAEVVRGMEEVYAGIAASEEDWLEAGGPRCPAGCGECCRGFEPDIREGEALYLAAWLIDHAPGRARALAGGSYTPPPGGGEGTCVLFDAASPFHCTAYGGRCLICRLFGYTGDYGKDGRPRFRPCRFYPDDALRAQGLERRQYGGEELLRVFPRPPAAMTDFMARAIALSPGGAEPRPLRDALPDAVRRLLWLQGLCGGAAQ